MRTVPQDDDRSEKVFDDRREHDGRREVREDVNPTSCS